MITSECLACNRDIHLDDDLPEAEQIWLDEWDDADCQRAPDGLHEPVLGEVPEHHNDLGDWCPHSGEYTEDGTCPVWCREADEIAGFDAGDRNES